MQTEIGPQTPAYGAIAGRCLFWPSRTAPQENFKKEKGSDLWAPAKKECRPSLRPPILEMELSALSKGVSFSKHIIQTNIQMHPTVVRSLLYAKSRELSSAKEV